METLSGMLVVTGAAPLLAAEGGGGAQAIGLLIALAVGVWVALDAQKHELKLPVLWGVGVFLFLIVVLPAYLIVRYRHDHQKTLAAPAAR